MIMLGELFGAIGGLGAAGIDAATTAQQNALDREFNAGEAQKARDFNAAEAQKNRDYQTQMSNTAYQRAMADMKAAGINPALAFQQGGASSPSGSSASSPAAHFQSRGYGNTAMHVANAFGAIGNALTQRAEAMSAMQNAQQSLSPWQRRYLASLLRKMRGK
ncbi:DNA pilot protein [Microvirus mar12]|uniref:DNA pilot protein n=1 Tax=Microvirus mar12 TaxID=2851144 RepID=A0A8F5MK31_9VIRU|nr:DNA pilot protein [Microvirus mar12]